MAESFGCDWSQSQNLLDEKPDRGGIESRTDADERRRGHGESVDFVRLANGFSGATPEEPTASRAVVEPHQCLGPHHHGRKRFEQAHKIPFQITTRQRNLAAREAMREGMGEVVTMSFDGKTGNRFRTAPGKKEIGGESVGVGAFRMWIDRGHRAGDRP